MSSERTEQATPQKLKKARDKGQFPVAKDFVSAVQFLGIVVIITSWGQSWFENTQHGFHTLLKEAFRADFSTARWGELVRATAWEFFLPLLMAGGLLMLITLAAQLASTGLGFSLTKLAPDLNRLNPMSRLKDLPQQNLTSLLQAFVLLGIMCWVVYSLISDNVTAFLLLPLTSVQNGSVRVVEALSNLLWKMAVIIGVIGAIDFFRQRQRFNSQMKMSKQDIRDEHKESEGNPQMKGRIRRLMRDRRRRKMMADVSTATAIIVNPTHYAVAIKYDPEKMGSPKVIAKGKNYLARRIRERAMEYEVPIVENVPLARGLYAAVEVGQEIPPAFFKAVAEVLAYIYKLTGSRRLN
jgi:flagellar biosynthetic protein FlhB